MGTYTLLVFHLLYLTQYLPCLTERPIRSFEILFDICYSWVADKTVNMLMAKKKAAPNALPTSPPVWGGYVQWEYKRGKWQKRRLVLKEHSSWLSKKEGVRRSISLRTCSCTDVGKLSPRIKFSCALSATSTRMSLPASTKRINPTLSP